VAVRTDAPRVMIKLVRTSQTTFLRARMWFPPISRLAALRVLRMLAFGTWSP
jgi:hypothetical protein